MVKRQFVMSKLKGDAIQANNFGAVRLFAAWLVIYGHGQDMVGLPTPTLWSRPVAQIGLDLFFSVSGYLIYDSWLRDPRAVSFVVKRALRIFPGLAACVLLCILVIGPAETELPLGRYFTHHATWQYLFNSALYLRLYLPGVFTHRLLGGAVNGSLWSLFPEFLCYLAVPVIWLTGPEGRRLALLAVMAGCGAAGLYMFAYHPTGYSLIYSADPKYVLVQVPFFMAGAFWRDLQRWMPGVFRPDLALLVGDATFVAPEAFGAASVPLRWLTLSYAVLALSLLSTPILRRAARWGDLSYGAYLYAFPIQQAVLEHGVRYPVTVATALSLAMGFVSWHLVEHPALRLKPSRGRRPETALGLPETVGAKVERKPDWVALGRRLHRLATATPLLPVLAALLLLAAASARLGFGHWHLPDYTFVGALRSDHWGRAGTMALGHPLAALLMLPYTMVVLRTGSAALVSFCLGLGVLAAASAVLAAAMPLAKNRLWAMCLALVTFAFGVAVAGPADSPWVASSVLPLAAAVAALPFLAAALPNSFGLLVLTLTLAAGSGPAGAGLALGVAAGFSADAARRRAALVVPVAVAIVVLAAAPSWAGVSSWPPMPGLGWPLFAFAAGLAACWEAWGDTRLAGGTAMALLLGCAGGVVAAVLAAEPAFAPVLAALSLAVGLRWLFGRAPALRLAVPVMPPVLAAALVPALLQRLPWNADAQTYHFAVEARTRTWASAHTSGPAMEFYLPPDDLGMLTRPAGVYTVKAGETGPLEQVGRVFNKTVIAVCAPWQQHESWLIDGRFVPACPPRDGPADHVVVTR